MGAYARKDREPADQRGPRAGLRALPAAARSASKQVGGTLSGGEQQMLAIGRALMARPKLLLLDEPSMGLAPMLIQQIFSIIAEINQQGTTVLLVEQNAQQALQIAHRAYVLETGEIVKTGGGARPARRPAGEGRLPRRRSRHRRHLTRRRIHRRRPTLRAPVVGRCQLRAGAARSLPALAHPATRASRGSLVPVSRELSTRRARAAAESAVTGRLTALAAVRPLPRGGSARVGCGLPPVPAAPSAEPGTR